MPLDTLDAIHIASRFAAARTGLLQLPYTSLFRYVGLDNDIAWQYLEQTVLENRLVLARANFLNDPFDNNPIVVNDLQDPANEITAALDNLAKQNNTTTLSNILGHVVGEDGNPLNRKDRAQMVITSLSSALITSGDVTHIASFSRRISSQLLWSHYAGGYKGLAYHFVIRPNISTVFGIISSVTYDRQRPIVLLSEMLERLTPNETKHLNRVSFFRRAFLTKSVEWSYEEEERLLSQLNEVLFHPRELAGLIVGPRFSSDALIRLKAITERRSTPLPIYQAKLSDTDYAIDVQWSDPI